MTPLSEAMFDTELKLKELARWQRDETVLVFLENQAKSCYTMRLVKFGKIISEANSEENNIGQLLCQLLDEVPIDPKYIKLH